ncbi:MAG: right-handed parallel beta-helix repeat-containing protein [Chloroflexota bacterium]|nr:right-handed parallel beta-helix repeat-containing protein [Chloroflexota bacterium]
MALALLGSTVTVRPLGSARAAGAVVNVPAELPTIQAAIDAVADGGIVLVAPGVYRENLDFHGRRIEVRSADGPISTVIDGGGAGPVVTFDQSETRATSLRGFTVRNGNPGGFRISGASPTITGNLVTANTAYEGGGFLITGSSALIEDNVVRGNTAGYGGGGGFHLGSTSGLEVVGNTIEHNTAPKGGGMALFTALDALILNNVFRGNRATIWGGGAIEIVNYSWPLISQNVFVDNESVASGGALDILVPVGAQGAVLANNTLVGNRAPAGSAVHSGGDWFAVNNIFSGPSTVDVVRCQGSISGRFFYNDVYNGTDTPFRWCPDTTGIVGNISVDPRLGPDFGLTQGSPAIDAGHDDPLIPLLFATDANGAARVVDGNGDGTAAADLGAFEWPGAGLPAPRHSIPGAYHPLSPVRILDTRSGLGAGPGKVGAGGTLSLQVTGRGGVPATGVTAVALNVTVTEPTAGSFLTAWPAGDSRPLASNLNYEAGTTKPNMVVVKVGAGGKVNLFNNVGSAHVIADVAGWYGPYLPAPGATFTPLPPSRLLDTRAGNGAPAQRVPAGGTVNLQVTGRGGVPATGVSAVVLNVTVTQPDAVSFLAVYPSGKARPLVSNLNYRAGDTVANVVVVKVGPDGRVVLYNNAGSTDVIADVAGWYGT